MIRIDRQWSFLIHIGINFWILIFINLYWSALGIDSACPVLYSYCHAKRKLGCAHVLGPANVLLMTWLILFYLLIKIIITGRKQSDANKNPEKPPIIPLDIILFWTPCNLARYWNCDFKKKFIIICKAKYLVNVYNVFNFLLLKF